MQRTACVCLLDRNRILGLYPRVRVLFFAVRQTPFQDLNYTFRSSGCQGSRTETSRCDLALIPSCTDSPSWTQWSDWSTCRTPCPSFGYHNETPGHQLRTRMCNAGEFISPDNSVWAEWNCRIYTRDRPISLFWYLYRYFQKFFHRPLISFRYSIGHRYRY